MRFVGGDGCRAGWLTVSFDEHGWQVELFADVRDLYRGCDDASLILLDVPMGLKDGGDGERRCDVEARRLLGPKRRSSVFPTPHRPAVYASSYLEACSIQQQLTGRKLSVQSWNISSKIREVDRLLCSQPSARQRLKEIHPEICFWALGGRRPLEHSKRSPEGFAQRLQLLQSVCPHTNEVLQHALSRFRRREVARDDILDALVSAVTAACSPSGLNAIPTTPEFDACGLPMQMLFVAAESSDRRHRNLWS